MMGLYILKLPALVEVSVEELAAAVAPTLPRYIDGPVDRVRHLYRLVRLIATLNDRPPLETRPDNPGEATFIGPHLKRQDAGDQRVPSTAKAIIAMTVTIVAMRPGRVLDHYYPSARLPPRRAGCWGFQPRTSMSAGATLPITAQRPQPCQ
jgi:hypothetical protein